MQSLFNNSKNKQPPVNSIIFSLLFYTS